MTNIDRNGAYKYFMRNIDRNVLSEKHRQKCII